VQVAAPPGGAVGLFTWRNAFGGGVLAFALLGFVGTGWILFGGGLSRSDPPTTLERSIAVMPCTDSSAPGVPTPLTQGFAEGIINALAKLPNLKKVSGLTSVIELLAQNATTQTIAERLDVATVLECSLQQVGEMVRVALQLVEVATSGVLWSDVIEGPATDLFELQDQAARAVTDELQVTLAGGAETRLVAQGTAVPEAYQAYWLGRFFWNQRTEASLRNAITEFERAVDLDSLYAEAWSGLADSYLVVDSYVLSAEDQDYRTNSEQGLIAARRAVSLAPDLGMAHTSLGFGRFLTGDWESPEREFDAAIELAPGYATAHQWFGNFLRHTGRAAEAVVHAEQAFELDPVSKIIAVELGRALIIAGRVDEAIERFSEATELDPNWWPGWSELALSRARVGDYPAGREAWEQFVRSYGLEPEGARAAFQALVTHYQTGEVQTFPELDVEWFTLFTLYAGTGQLDRANDTLENLLQQGAYHFVAALHARQTSDALRDDPRYQALLEEAGITW